MNKKLIKDFWVVAIVVIAICVAGFAFDRIAPAGMVQAASETHPAVSKASPTENIAISFINSTQPVVYVAVGLVCILFGTIAILPLLTIEQKLYSQEPTARKDLHELGSLYDNFVMVDTSDLSPGSR